MLLCKGLDFSDSFRTTNVQIMLAISTDRDYFDQPTDPRGDICDVMCLWKWNPPAFFGVEVSSEVCWRFLYCPSF
jgi:hypothetical protein